MTATMPLPVPATTTCWHGTDQIPWHWGRSVVLLGVFDGLHRGHARLLEHATELGRRRHRPVVLTTFDPHPATVAGPRRDTTPLVGLERRVELAHEHGADAVLVLPFCATMARTRAVDFVRDVLVGSLRATDVVVGANFRFGHRGAGDVRLLRRLGPRHDFTVHGIDLLPGCSSTRVRELLGAGDPAGAAEVLGRPHRVRCRRAGELLRASTMLPAPGRYRVRALGHETEAEVHADGILAPFAALPAVEIEVTFLDRA